MYQEKKELTNVPVPELPTIPKWKWLADAIREGCKLVPKQCTGSFFRKGNRPLMAGGYLGATHACAFGAALVYYQSIGQKMPNEGQLICDKIYELNDFKHRKREWIADWLETKEAEEWGSV